MKRPLKIILFSLLFLALGPFSAAAPSTTSPALCEVALGQVLQRQKIESLLTTYGGPREEAARILIDFIINNYAPKAPEPPLVSSADFTGSEVSRNYLRMAEQQQLLNQSDPRLNAQGLLLPNGGLCASTCYVNVIGATTLAPESIGQFSSVTPQIIGAIVTAYKSAHRQDLNSLGAIGQLITAIDPQGVLSDGRRGASLFTLAKMTKPVFQQLGAAASDLLPATEVNLANSSRANGIMVAGSSLYKAAGQSVGGPHGQHALVILKIDTSSRTIWISDPNRPNRVYTRNYNLNSEGKPYFSSLLDYDGPTTIQLNDYQLIQR